MKSHHQRHSNPLVSLFTEPPGLGLAAMVAALLIFLPGLLLGLALGWLIWA